MESTNKNLEKFVVRNQNKALHMCRICLKSSTELEYINLFSDNRESVAILRKIYLCTQMLLSNENILPRFICRPCTVDLENANSFRIKCITSETNFKFLYLQEQEDKTSLKGRCIDLNSVENKSKQHEITREPFEPGDATEVNSIKSEICIFTKKDKNVKSNGSMNANYTCELCGKLLKTSSSLSRHKVSMHEKRQHIGKVTGSGVQRLYHCTSCPYSTPHSQTLVNHMRTHTGERPYVCECGKQFTQLSSLMAHRKTHSDVTFYTCPLCGKQFKYKDVFKKHQLVHRTGSFVCDICKKVLKSRQSLQDHLCRHYNVRNYNCDMCGATFITHSELLNHKLTHSLKKGFHCNFCDYKSYRKKTLILHINRHTGKREHKCDLCNDVFYTLADLKRHKRKHSRQKNYSCPTCCQRFAHSSSVNKHMRNIHRISYTWNDNIDRKIVKPLFTVCK